MDLFLGFPVDSACSLALEKADSRLLDTFISEKYLVDLAHEKGRFLGKRVGNEVTLSDLELVEANILSLLKRILPDFTISPEKLVLFSS